MNRWLVATIFFLIGYLWLVPSLREGTVYAQFDLPTCKVGVHMISASDEDYIKAAQLINANGGDYCWMTVVFREDEMTVEHLQRIHNLARENRFQIIHRIEKGFDSTGKWYMPDEQTTQKFIDVMKTVRPASEDIYVVAGNEPTHALMCGGCTPESYAHWAKKSIDMLHAAPFHAVVMLAGQDVHSPQSPPNYYDAGFFMDGMFAAEPELPCIIDAWAAHSYPLNYIGSPLATGRLSPRGYEWELRFVESKAPEQCKEHVRNLPVFITETGYKVGASGISDVKAYENMQSLIDVYNNDSQVMGFTVFAYTFCGEPFEAHAVADCEGRALNGAGRAMFDVAKTAGEVRHIYKAETIIDCPKELVSNMEVTCTISVKNLGTDIWKNIGGDYALSLVGYVNEGRNGPRYSFSRFRSVKPGETLTSQLTYNPGVHIGTHNLTVGLSRNGRLTQALAQVSLEAFDMPELAINSENIIGNMTNATDNSAEVQVFDGDESIIFRRKITIADGVGSIGKVSGVVFDKCYRAVLLVPGNLPVQKQCVTFQKGLNTVEMPRLLPIDTNNDGKLSLGDILNRYSYQ